MPKLLAKKKMECNYCCYFREMVNGEMSDWVNGEKGKEQSGEN